MLTFLIKRFVRDYQHTEKSEVRQGCGMVAGLLGIVLNILLFAGKLLAGLISGSIAVTADAFNNLSDAGSSLITLLGFRLSAKKPDPDHPYGHGRIEYISGLIVAMIILLMGVELLKSSFAKIVASESVAFSGLTAVILLCSVGVKVYMCLYNRALAKKIESAAMQATALDSLSDSVATLVVLIAMLIGHFTGLSVDGWAGLVVSLFILYTGLCAARDTINPLLGEAPNPELVRRIQDEVLSDPAVLGIHDLMLHDYGPGRRIVSLHAEVPAEGNILVLHDRIDSIEQKLKADLGCEAVIHMDPIVTDDGRIAPLRAQVLELLRERIDEGVNVHDFRMVEGQTHTNLIFDVVAPFALKKSDGEVSASVRALVRELDPHYIAVIKVDRG